MNDGYKRTKTGSFISHIQSKEVILAKIREKYHITPDEYDISYHINGHMVQFHATQKV